MKNVTILIRSIKEVTMATPLFSLINIIILGLFAVLPVAITILVSELLDAITQYLNGQGGQNGIIYFGSLFVLLYLIQYSLYTVQSISENYGIYEKTLHILKMRLGLKYARLPLIAHEDADTHNLAQRAKECVQNDMIPKTYLLFLKSISLFIGIVGISLGLTRYHILLLPVCLLSTIPYLISRILRGKEFYRLKYNQAPLKRKEDYYWKLFSNSSAVKEFRVTNTSDYMMNKWLEIQKQVSQENWKFHKKDSRSLLFCNLLKSMSFIGCFILILYLLQQKQLSIGVFGASIYAIREVQNGVKNLMLQVGSLPQYASIAADYYEFLDLEEENNGVQKLADWQTLSVDAVSFSYPNAHKKAINDVSFIVNQGEKVVIVGENGSGKTTLAKLLLGFFEPNEGTIYYDQVSLNELEKENFYRQVAMMPQDFGQYELTLRENIGISAIEKMQNDAAIRQVLTENLFEKSINLDDQIGRDFEGQAFSGGEWQKIALSRTMFKESRQVFLDEPTSALDPVAETEILKKLLAISESKTAFIVSHRVGLAKYADRILVMREGKLVENGTFQELLEMKAEFYRLYTTQGKWYQTGE
ncbi:hypothetical protein BAU15_09390 [Enterococcus sp. JM4C]|uniref:ABC transporter ATP-binding protein n=1 Tax=Candidatus Enterococcus huntleyi TaxID=1857217 RepID=UPI001379FDAF|nr:ABC transporter ATP-binding protein [Enterococcus sp. JM4C]KAF1298054.1 hypothetical protein BAU15_09390 [Enterococcus sp. JM4C]